MNQAMAHHTPKVPIIEDNASFRQTLKEMLCERFPLIAVDEAADGEEGLKEVEISLPDLIFMDIKMPGKNGLELTRQIKREHADIVIVILTNYDFPEYQTTAFKYGASYFLSKGSSSREEILTLVRSILSDTNDGPSASK